MSASKAAAAPARERPAAASSARDSVVREPAGADSRTDAPIAGPYLGMTGGRFPRTVQFRFLGSGIRDLMVDDRLVARWIRVGPDGGTAIVGSTRVKLTWAGERAVSGWIQRGRGSKIERIRFTATHRFARP